MNHLSKPSDSSGTPFFRQTQITPHHFMFAITCVIKMCISNPIFQTNPKHNIASLISRCMSIAS
jgi:hypothetical protein